MQHPDPTFPSNACAYGIYDTDTFRPLNESTHVRLLELGWTRDEFEGARVLDIGSSSGVLSLHAHQLGAREILAREVQQHLVDFFGGVVERHRLPISVARKAFWDLDPATEQADIVLFMEVLHWIVDQGGEIAPAIAHVASLTGRTLYLETPWDINEPSLTGRGVSAERYNIELIVRELSKHFADVSVLKFMTYFGRMPGSKRVLLRASGRRSGADALAVMEHANIVRHALRRSSNDIDLLTTPDGPRVLKSVPAYSILHGMDDAPFERLCAFLGSIETPIIAPPLRIGEGFRHRASGQVQMLFPFVGQLATVMPVNTAPWPVPREVIGTVMTMRRQMVAAPPDLIAELRAACPPVSFPRIDYGRACQAFIEIPDAISLMSDPEIVALWRDVEQRLRVYDRAQEDAICHCDVQRGNFVTDDSGRLHMVDIDLMRTGPAFADALTACAYDGLDAEAMRSVVANLEQALDRSLTQFDLDFAVWQVAGWFGAILDLGVEAARGMHDELARVLIGMKAMAALRL